MGDWLKLEQVRDVFMVDESLCSRILADAGSDVTVKYGICKTEIILVRLAAEAVGRSLFHEVDRKTEFFANGNHLADGQASQRSEISSGVTVTCRVTDPVFRQVARICHTAVH